MTTLVTFRQGAGFERVWVPADDEVWWIRYWSQLGVPSARLADYKAWGGFYPPPHRFRGSVMLRGPRRARRDYRRFVLP
jgi:hypothetical protein